MTPTWTAVLSRGVMISDEVVLGPASVDLVRLRLQTMLYAADRTRRPES